MEDDNLKFRLADFFNYYLQIEQDSSLYDEDFKDQPVGFYDSINMKKEFHESRATANDPLPKIGEALPHQRFLSRFFSPYTPYDRLLVFHGIGTGKTCVIASVVELAKRVQSNFKKVLVLVRNPTLEKNMIKEIAYVCTCAEKVDDTCTDGPYIAKLTAKEQAKTEGLTPAQLQERRTINNVKQVYDVMTFQKAAKLIKTAKATFQLEEMFKDTYIIIDEAHNIKEQESGKRKEEDDVGEAIEEEEDIEDSEEKTKSKPKKRKGAKGKKDEEEDEEEEETVKVSKQKPISGFEKYKLIWELCHNVKGTKVMLLTATPMKDKPETEFIDVVNLLLPESKQLRQEDIKFDNAVLAPETKELIKERMKGKVSYLRVMVSSVDVQHAGQILPPLIYTKVFPLTFSNLQQDTYYNAFSRDSGGKIAEDNVIAKQSMWLNSIYTSLMVFPDGTFGMQNDAKFLHYFNKKGEQVTSKVAFERVSITQALRSYLEQDGNGTSEKLARLATLSVKYAFAIKQILENPQQKIFVYSRFVNGGGNLMFAALLDYFGFNRMVGAAAADGERRFIFISGQGSSVQASNLIKYFNDKQNIHGDVCQVVIGSHVIGEGISLKCIRKTFILSPFWNDGTIEQAIGRSIRTFSHNDLPRSEQNIEIYRMAGMLDYDFLKSKRTSSDTEFVESSANMTSIDMIMYKTSEDKDIKIKQIERALKESAVDCTLNKDRNVLRRDEKNSKACDYLESCEYTCDGVTELSRQDAGKLDDTYNLFYADAEIAMIIEQIKYLFMIKNAYDFEELYERLKISMGRTMNSIVLARALYEMISRNTHVYNRMGFLNYVRTDRNMYFLVDDPMVGSFYWNAMYADQPKPEIANDNFIDMFLNTANEQLNYVLERVEETGNTDEIRVILSNLPVSLFNQVIESAYAMPSGGLSKIADIYKEHFSKIKLGGVEYAVNSFNTDQPRVAKVGIWDWGEDAAVVQEVKQKRKSRVKELSKNNILMHYGTIDPTSKKFSIKKVQLPVYTATGKESAKVSREGEGTVCKQGMWNLTGLQEAFIFIISTLAKSRGGYIDDAEEWEDIDPPLLRPLPKAYTTKDVQHWLNTVLSNGQINSYISKMFWNPTYREILLNKTRGKNDGETLVNLAKLFTYTNTHKTLANRIFGEFGKYLTEHKMTAASAHTVIKSFGSIQYNPTYEQLLDFMLSQDNHHLTDYLDYLVREEDDPITFEEEDRNEMFSQISEVPIEFIEDTLSGKTVDVIDWDVSFLYAYYLVITTGDLNAFCEALKEFFVKNDLIMSHTKKAAKDYFWY